jgi:hypothetical protein
MIGRHVGWRSCVAGIVCLVAAVSSPVRADTITDIGFSGPGGNGWVESLLPARAVEVGSEYFLVDVIDMDVTVDGAGTYLITERVTNSTNVDWSDFNWDLRPLDSDDQLFFTRVVNFTSSLTLDSSVADALSRFGQSETLRLLGDVPSGGEFFITYEVYAPSAMTFTVRQYDAVVVTSPIAGMALAGLAMMICGGAAFRGKWRLT